MKPSIALIDTAKGSVAVDQANAIFAEQENKRYGDLATSGYGSVQNAQNAAAKIASARASIERDTGTLQSMTKQLDVIKAQTAQARAALAHEEAAERQAELNLSYTTIVAPVDGTVGNRTLRVGQFVQAGTQLMSVVPTDAAYVVANYKETQLTDVKRGQPATIEVDMFPGRVFHGHVDSMAPASGQTFALLPPDNATGNFTKVVQRIPVKIMLDPESERSGDLRPGMSVEPSIDTTAASQISAARSRMIRARCKPALEVSLMPTTLPSATRPAGASTRDWIAVLAGMIGAFMAILNIQITNASLLDIEGGIGTGVDNGAWVSTAYLIGEIVVIPLTDYMSRVFSFRRYVLANAILFPLFSIACSFTHDLGSMIVMRGLQGFTGGILIPVAFTMVLTKLPKHQQPIGLAIFALAVTFAPAIGPTIGGYHDGELWLADDLLHQRPAEPYHGRRPCAHARGEPHAAQPPQGGRLGRHLRHDDRVVGVSDRARGRQQGRLARVAIHPAAGHHRSRVSDRVRRDRTQGGEAAGQPAAPQTTQFRHRRAGQHAGGICAVRLGLHPAAISRPSAALQRRADRQRAGLDRPAATHADPARAAADEAVRRALSRLSWGSRSSPRVAS